MRFKAVILRLNEVTTRYEFITNFYFLILSTFICFLQQLVVFGCESPANF